MKSVRLLFALICTLGLLIPGPASAQDCANATDITCGATLSGDTTGGTAALDQYDCIGWELTSPESYFKFTLTNLSVVTVLLEPDAWDPALIVLPEDGGECGPASLGCMDEIGVMAEEVSVTLPPGTYYVVVDGYDGDVGAFDLTVTCCDDTDGDGFGAQSCGGSDCCDSGDEGGAGCDAANAPDIFPGAVDWCMDGIDHDCDEEDCCPDLDGDGFAGANCGGTDCCDEGTEDSPGCSLANAPDIYPRAEDVCGDAIDDNCNGYYEEICPICAADSTIDCETANSGSLDNSTGTNNVNDYCINYPDYMFCLGVENGIDWSAPEIIMGFTPPEDTGIIFEISNLSANSFLDIFIMTDHGPADTCNPGNVVGIGGRSFGNPPQPAMFMAEGGKPYFVSIDGQSGSVGTCDWTMACFSGESCVVDTPLGCDATVAGDSTGLDNDVNFYPYDYFGLSANGPEYVYSFTSPVDTTATIDLSFDAALDMALYVLEDDGSGNCLPINAIAASDGSTTLESVTFIAAADATYFVVVEGFTPTDAGAFSITTGCVGCAEGETLCGERDCVDTGSDVIHCGGCGMACDLFGVDVHDCVAGDCEIGTCDTDFEDCNLTDADGCEADTMSNNDHCGGCDSPCVDPNPVCIAGVCSSCPAGTTLCDGSCVDTDTDEGNCGGCGVACGAGETCCGGSCVDLATDVSHCGDCAVACVAGEDCVEGLCCTAGLANCGGACVDLATDPDNCGDCAVACDLTNVDVHGCAAGSCTIATCDAEYGDCDSDATNGCEVDTTTSLDHCGACDNACDLANVDTQACDAGACTIVACTESYDDCDDDDSNGCETEIGTVDDCGECGDACSTGQACAGGDCCNDADGDNHYNPTGCAAGDDCDDNDDSAYPGADEVCDEVDNDCDGNIDETFDGDNDGFTSCGGDCDDNNNQAYPGADEVCGDDVDQDCNGSDLDCDCPDADNDTHPAETCGGDDCNDNDAAMFPGNEEVCGDEKDNNCNGETDEDCGGGDDGCGCSAAGGSQLPSGLLILLLVLGMVWLPSRRR